MDTFSKQLLEARQQKGMTQEELAKHLAVTRQTVSSWEKGRTEPDIKTIYRISEVLGVRFIDPDAAPKAADDAQMAPEAMPEAVSEEAPEAAPKRRGKKWLIAGAAVLVCAAVIALLIARNRPAADDFPRDLYAQTAPNEAGKPYLAFENKVWDEEGPGTIYRRYSFTMTEQNGVAFDVDRIEVLLKGTTGKNRSATLTAEDLRNITYDPHIGPNASLMIDGGFPTGEYSLAGIAVIGSAEGGEEMTFYDLIEL